MIRQGCGGAVRALLLGVPTLVLASCGGGVARGTDAATNAATDAEWRALATARPAPLPGAVRLAFDGVELLGDAPRSIGPEVTASLGLAELVVAGLIRRRDVHFVERRRFAAAVAAEREGRARAPGAPAAGTSPGAEIVATATWIPLAPPQATLEVRLADAESGAVVGTSRALVSIDADPVGLARTIVATVLGTLDEAGRLPEWTDPAATAATVDPTAPGASGVPEAALSRFLEGLLAEERWDWEGARLAYREAGRSVGFFEARAALARAARLRLGGTLGES